MSHRESVAIYWDYENCRPPSQLLGYDIVNNIRRVAHAFGSVTVFRAYLEVSEESPKSSGLRSELQTSGVSLIDCPHSGRKDVVDKMILVDMLAYAIDHSPPATIMLISGDRDYAYAVSILRLRQYKIVLVVPPAAHTSLKSQASVIFDWNHDILGKQNPTKLPSPVKQLELNTDDDFVACHPPGDTGGRGSMLLSPSSPLTLVGECRPVSARDLCESQPSGHVKNSKSTDSTLKPPTHSVCREAPDSVVRSRSSTTVLQESPIPTHAIGSNKVHNDRHVSPPAPDVAKLQTPVHSNHTVRDPSMDLPVDGSKQMLRAVAKPFTPEYKPAQTIAADKEKQAESLSQTMLNGTCNSLVDAMHKAPSTAKSDYPVVITERACSSLTINDKYQGNYYVIPGDTVNAVKEFESVVEDDLTEDTDENIVGREDLARFRTPVMSQSHGRPRSYSLPKDIMFDDVVTNATSMTSTAVFHAVENSSGIPDANTAHNYEANSAFSRIPTAPPLCDDLEKSETQTQTSVAPTASLAVDIAPLPMTSSTSTNPSIAQSSLVVAVVADSQTQNTPSKLVPPQFQPLVEFLVQDRTRGIHKPLRSTIAMRLMARDKAIYKRAGADRFSQYTALAKDAGIIRLGGTEGDAWISLHPDWH